MPKPHEITSDGKTVWINDSQGCCIGRFSRAGIDVHHDGEAQRSLGVQCLDCKSGPCGPSDWSHFKEAMWRHFQIIVGDQYMPNYLRQALAA